MRLFCLDSFNVHPDVYPPGHRRPERLESAEEPSSLYVGALIASIVFSLGYTTGAAMNPARDLMPRLFTLMAGWGTETFRCVKTKLDQQPSRKPCLFKLEIFRRKQDII